MDFQLNETEQLLADGLDRFVREAQAAPRGGMADHRLAFAMGWHGASVPEQLGGYGLGLVGAMLVAEQLEAALSPVCWQRAAVLPALALAAVAKDGNPTPLDDFLSGNKHFFMSARPGWSAGGITLRLTDSDGPQATLCPDGLLTPTAGLRQELQLAAHVVAAAQCLGAMQRLFDLTLDHAKIRQQFGQPLSRFQALQHRLVDMYVALEEARSLVMAAAMTANEGAETAQHLGASAWIKARTGAQRIAEEAIQIHGGLGMTDECQVGKHVKRVLRMAPCLPNASA